LYIEAENNEGSLVIQLIWSSKIEVQGVRCQSGRGQEAVDEAVDLSRRNIIKALVNNRNLNLNLKRAGSH
jgi:hypothetical protein